MRCSTKGNPAALAAVLAAALALGAAPAPPPFRAGHVFGEADCVYLLTGPAEAPPPPAVSLPGYRQRAARRETGWEVTVHSKAGQVTGSFAADAARLAQRFPDLPEAFSAAAADALPKARTAEEACVLIAQLLRHHLAYAPRRKGSEEPPPAPREALRRGEGDCVDFAGLASELLACGGVVSRPVVGLRAPADGLPLALEGGALHVWLEVTAPGGRPAYFDPVFSAGWVPARYVVLRVGGGFGAGELARWRGGALRRIWQRDRLFAAPDPAGETLFWRAGTPDAAPGRALLCGKLLDGGDGPLPGTARLRGADAELTVPLWEGNFCFQDLPAGSYELTVEDGGAVLSGERVALSPLDIKSVVFYSRTLRRSTAGDGAGRQSGGSFPP